MHLKAFMKEPPLRILYIDDDEICLTLTQLQLIRADIHTETTTDALEAVGILSTQDLDLILLDSVMPTIDGLEFLQLMRALHLEHPVVFYTGSDSKELQDSVSEFDVLGFLDKNANRMDLPMQLTDLYAKHRRPINRIDGFGEHRAAS